MKDFCSRSGQQYCPSPDILDRFVTYKTFNCTKEATKHDFGQAEKLTKQYDNPRENMAG